MSDRPFFVVWVDITHREGVSTASFASVDAAKSYARAGLRAGRDLTEAIVVEEHARITAEEARRG